MIDAVSRRAMIARMAWSLLLLFLLLPAAVARGDAPALPAPSSARPEAWCGVREGAVPAPSPPRAAGPPTCFGCAEPATYRAFDGTVYTLTRYTGRFTELLLPDTFIDGSGLDAAARRLLLDRADFVYSHARELMGSEPAGDGRLQIAFVATTCGYGCGNVGSRGIEILSTDVARDEVRSDLAAGVLPRIVVHEMAHNFDRLNRDLWQGAPTSFDSHAWTSFFEQYLEIYTRMGSTSASPDDVQASWVRSTFEAYLANPEASWSHCVAEDGCGTGAANAAWGGVTHRFVQLHGPEAARRFLAALSEVRARNGPPQTLQDKADLHFEALSEASGTNLACYADAWRWSISPALRARMATRPAEPRCVDLDGDGASPLLGDCDDDDPAVGPGAKESANGRDDDCNGMIDDVLLAEPPGADFASARLSFPGRASGEITAGDTDSFWIDDPADGDVRFELCSQGFQGWLFVYDGNRWLGYQYTAKGQCSRKSYPLTKGLWRVAVELNNASEPGVYTLAAGPGEPWPQLRAAAAAPLEDACRWILPAGVGEASAAGTPDRTRFWVTGSGFVAETKPGAATRAAWYPEGGAPGSYEVREQPFADRIPTADWSGARTATFAPSAGAACEEDPDGDDVVSGRDDCPLTADPAQLDVDGDGVGDVCDDCVVDANGPLRPDAGVLWQRDTDGDGYGNVCDADFDQDGLVNFADLATLKRSFYGLYASADLDGDGVVNFRDLVRLKSRFLRAPGPSGLHP